MSLEALITEATSENNTSDDWGRIIEICERADASESAAREAVAALTRHVLHRNVNVILFSLTVANSLAQNCGMPVKREMSSRAFLDALVRQVNNKASVHVTVRSRILELISQWAEAFRSEPALDYMVQVYNQLRAEGHKFTSSQPKPAADPRSKDKEREEEEELQLASRTQNSQPKFGRKPKPAQVLFQVRALYDFHRTEEGELDLVRGDVVDVYDCTTYPDWWKGSLRGTIGIFPANYVERVPEGAAQATADPDAFVLSHKAFVTEFRDRVSRADPGSTDYAETDRLQTDYHKVLELRPHVIKTASEHRQKQEELTAVSEKLSKATQSFHALLEAHAQYQHQAAAAAASASAAAAAAAAAAVAAYAGAPGYAAPAYTYGAPPQPQQPQQPIPAGMSPQPGQPMLSGAYMAPLPAQPPQQMPQQMPQQQVMYGQPQYVQPQYGQPPF
ncbi:ESCRT-0 subunit protein hse1 [Polyrhizophydium stewartii]|uniref:Class E vacuolar protein-sorting machinery protein HSE1 n=1 Tax=Polyrhizophydium stewartii TaxID=2732419 RepID=A0ABR4N1M7_9FUNG